MPTLPAEWLVGPVAALALALWVISVLWKAHAAADADVRDKRDEAIAGWRDQTAATNRLAEAIETRNRRDAERSRAEDRRRA